MTATGMRVPRRADRRAVPSGAYERHGTRPDRR